MPMQNNDYSETAKNPEIVKQMTQLNLRITNKNVTTTADQNPFQDLLKQKLSSDSLMRGHLTPFQENSECNFLNFD